MATIFINEHQIFKFLFDEDAKLKTKKIDYKTAEETFVTEHNIQLDEQFQTFFKASWKQYIRLKQSHGKKGKDFILDLARKDRNYEAKLVVLNDSQTSTSEEIKKRRKNFIDLGQRMQKERTDSLIEYLESYIQKECPELSLTQLLGYLIYRTNIQSQKDIAKVGHQLFTDTVSSNNSFELQEAIALMHSLTLSKEQMRKMRFFFNSKDIYFPTTNELLEGRKRLRPTITSVLEDKGVQVQYKELEKMTVESALSLVLQERSVDDLNDLEMVFKDGGDGAGQQVIWNSKSMKDAKANMFQYGITPLKLSNKNEDGSKELLWLNHTPNASRTLRPLFLIREKETDDDLLSLVIPTTDAARKELQEEGLCIRLDDKAVNVKIVIHDSMKDLKFKKHISGLGGADCILCVSQQKDWTDKERVQEGFPINRSAEDTLRLFEELVDKDGNVPCKGGDFDTRQGVTKKPISTSDQMNITITHSYINVTTWFLKVLYRCHIDYQCWIEKKGPLGEPIRNSKDRVLDTIHEETGLYLDRVNRAGEKGGTSTNSPQGRRFFFGGNN